MSVRLWKRAALSSCVTAVNDPAADKGRIRRAVDAVMAPLNLARVTALRQTAITMGTDVGNELDRAIRHMPHS